MRALVETKSYAAVKCPEGRTGQNDWESAMRSMLEVCERLKTEGFRPLHYVPRLGVWVCEKPVLETFDENESTLKRWASEKN